MQLALGFLENKPCSGLFGGGEAAAKRLQQLQASEQITFASEARRPNGEIIELSGPPFAYTDGNSIYITNQPGVFLPDDQGRTGVVTLGGTTMVNFWDRFGGTENALALTLLHELGHILGLEGFESEFDEDGNIIPGASARNQQTVADACLPKENEG